MSLRAARERVAAQRGERGGDDVGGGEPGRLVHARRRIMVDEHVRQHHGAHLEAAVESARCRQLVQHVAAEAADRAFLDGDEHLVLLGEAGDQLAVERLHEARVGNGRRQAHGAELVCRLECLA